MAWAVIGENLGGTARNRWPTGDDNCRVVHRFEDWHDAAECYKEMVWEWSRTQDAFHAAVTGNPPEFGWVDTNEMDGFGDGMMPVQTEDVLMETGHGIGGAAIFKLMWEDEAGDLHHVRAGEVC